MEKSVDTSMETSGEILSDSATPESASISDEVGRNPFQPQKTEGLESIEVSSQVEWKEK